VPASLPKPQPLQFINDCSKLALRVSKSMKPTHDMIQSTAKSMQRPISKRTRESTAERASRVLREFARYEGKLQEWAGRCTVNALWYLSDPFGAMRSADIGIDEKLISELEALHGEFNRQRRLADARRTA
jgi:hypothetical protein